MAQRKNRIGSSLKKSFTPITCKTNCMNHIAYTEYWGEMKFWGEMILLYS